MKQNPQTPNNIFVLGNGESRHGYDLEQFKQYGKIYGCNALYRDFKPDGLISTDWAMMHEIYSSGYCFDNKCYFRQWKVLPYQFYDMMQYSGLEQNGLQELNKKLEEYKLPTVDKFIHESEMIKEFGNLVCHGIDPQRFQECMEELITELKNLSPDEIRQKLGNAGLWITWVDDNDKVKDLDDFFGGEFMGWSSGPTAVRVGIEENTDTTHVFLLGFDMTKDGLVNNVYKDTDCYVTSGCKFINPVNWIEQHTKNFEKYPHIKFYRVIDDNSEIEEWSKYDNVKTISYGNMFGHCVTPNDKYRTVI